LLDLGGLLRSFLLLENRLSIFDLLLATLYVRMRQYHMLRGDRDRFGMEEFVFVGVLDRYTDVEVRT
jgi:hypothetical protein